MAVATNTAFKIEGLRDLRKQLLALKDVAKSRKIVRRALRRAMGPVLEDARAGARVDTGALRDSIKLTAQGGRGAREWVLSVGIKIGRRKVKNELEGDDYETITVTRVVDAGWRWHFVERGTATAKAFPFLRPAWDRHVLALPGRFKAELQRAINRAVKTKRAET